MPIKDITSKDKYIVKHIAMYNKILDTWSYDALNDMVEEFDAVYPTYRDSYFLFSKDLKHVWFITESGYNYDYACFDNKELLINLVDENDYDLKKVAEVLGISPTDVFQVISKPEALNALLPMLELEDIVEERN